MAIQPTVSIAVTNNTISDNLNFLSPLGFQLLIKRLPNVQYMCQSATIPTISMNEAIQSNPFANIPRPGDKVTYEPLTVRFKIDEDMKNYIEIFNWIIGLGHPTNLDQYKTLQRTEGLISDGSLIVLTSNNNPNIRISFEGLFPISLSPLAFDSTQSTVEYLEADVSFRYTKFNLETL